MTEFWAFASGSPVLTFLLAFFAMILIAAIGGQIADVLTSIFSRTKVIKVVEIQPGLYRAVKEKENDD
jgi:hypothetical protein